MGISGSDVALMNAVSGLMRSGASRSGFMAVPGPYIDINGSDRTEDVDFTSIIWSEREGIGSDRSDLEFVLHSGSKPTEGHEVSLRIGSTGTDVFLGHITNIRRANVNTGTATSGRRWLCRCVDKTYLLNKMLVYGYYAEQSASALVTSLIGTFATDITAANVKGGAGDVGPYSFTLEPMSEVLQQIAADAGWNWYIDATADVHFYDTESVFSPEALTESSGNFWDMEIEESGDQIKTQILALGPPAALDGTHEDRFEDPPGPYADLRGNYDPTDPTDWDLLRVTESLSDPFTWLFTGGAGAANPDLFLIGGELVTFTNLQDDPTYIGNDGGGIKRIYFTGSSPLSTSYEVGELVYPVLRKTSGTAARAAIEGGDGVHEFRVDLSHLPTMDAVETVVDGILAEYAASRISGVYMTRDPNARAGGVVTINLANWYDHSSADYQIVEQETTWPESRSLMQRNVTFGKTDKSIEELLAKAVK